MTKAATLKLIDKAFRAVDYANLQDGYDTVAGKLYRMVYTAERQHRKMAPAGVKMGLTVSQASKLFVVRYLAEGLAKPDKWTVDDILSIRTECLYAQAYARKFSDELRAAWADLDLSALCGLSYADLMEV